MSALVGGHRLQAARLRLRLGSFRHMDQIQVPLRARGRGRRLGDDGREVPFAAGRCLSRRPLRVHRPRRNRLCGSQAEAAHDAAPGGGGRHLALHRRWCPPTREERHLAQAGGRRRGRVRGVDGRRHGAPSRLQGFTQRRRPRVSMFRPPRLASGRLRGRVGSNATKMSSLWAW